MRWEEGRESANVEDRRGGGGGFSMPGGRAGGVGLGGIVIAVVASLLFGLNPMDVLESMSGGGPVSTTVQQPSAPGQRGASGQAAAPDPAARFVSVVLASTEDTWSEVLAQRGMRYRPPTLVLFSGRTPTACGTGQAAAGPFYCPADQKLYIDLRFYEILRDRLGAPGDFAQAYVIAHEVGHHVQNLLGTMEQVQSLRPRLSEAQNNALSVRLELQADCYAGVWAARSQQARGWLESGDLDEAMQAAAAVGDDTLQRRSQGVAVPETFTHGSSAQRASWFRTGAKAGRIEQCDTFGSRRG